VNPTSDERCNTNFFITSAIRPLSWHRCSSITSITLRPFRWLKREWPRMDAHDELWKVQKRKNLRGTGYQVL